MSQPVVSTHPDFNAADADVVVQSADGVQFRLHRKYLGAATGAFPGLDDTAVISNPNGGDEDVVHLTEPTNVLEILFGFVYPKKHPVLDDADFEVLWPLAEAAEKYDVFSALDVCGLQFGRFIRQHGAEVFGYAIRHDYKRLMNKTALYLIRGNIPMAKIAEHLPRHADFVAWMQYLDAWKDGIDFLRNYQITNNNSISSCASCRPNFANLAMEVITHYEAEHRQYNDDVFSLAPACGSSCRMFLTLLNTWQYSQYKAKVQPFTEIMAGK